GMLHYMQGVSSVLLQEIFKEAGFLVLPVSEYVASLISETGIPFETEEIVSEQMESYKDDKYLEVVPKNDISMLDKPVKYFYEDAIYVTFLKYCDENNIQKFSE